MEGAIFFFNKFFDKEIIPKKPIGVMFLTSLRDIALCEHNGSTIEIDGTSHYIKGVIESTLEESKKGGILEDIVEVKGVIYDDTIEDLGNKFPLLPNKENWIFPLDLLDESKIWNICSSFRKLSLSNTKERKVQKYNFELEIYKKMKEVGADILILDSYMARLDYLYKLLKNKVINIHPGPTLLGKDFCFRGPDPIKDAINYSKESGSLVYTGATLHFVNSHFDDGRAIAYICNTPVTEDNEIALMYQNYINAKIPIFLTGVKHYIMKIYPYI